MSTPRLACSLSLLMFVVLGCSGDVPSPSPLETDALAPLLNQGQGKGQVPLARNFVAPLTGHEEVPPVDTRARGMTHFQLSSSGDAIEYRLIVANLHNVTMAHIHVGARGVNGPVVVWLYPDSPPPQLIEGRTSGILATGTFTEADLVGPLAGATFDDLLELLHAEETYVNVHTSQFPPGEIRGQIRPAGPGN